MRIYGQMFGNLNKRKHKNYTIFLREPENLFFGYWENYGVDFEAKPAKVAVDLRMPGWLIITDLLQIRIRTSSPNSPNEQWSITEEVLQTD